LRIDGREGKGEGSKAVIANAKSHYKGKPHDLTMPVLAPLSIPIDAVRIGT